MEHIPEQGIPSGHVTDVDEYGTAAPDVAERRGELTDAERTATIEELAEESGIEDPTIEWKGASWDPKGQWSDGTLRLNEGLLDDPRMFPRN